MIEGWKGAGARGLNAVGRAAARGRGAGGGSRRWEGGGRGLNTVGSSNMDNNSGGG